MRIEVLFWLLALGHYRAKLLSSIEVSPTGCWEWRRSGDGRYGHFWMLGVRFKSHVAAALLWQGVYLRHRLRVLRHECDNMACCCPDHLRPGSQKQNQQDASERGRRANGGLTRRTAARIRNLCSRGHTDTEVAKRCGCHRSTVGRIRQRQIRG